MAIEREKLEQVIAQMRVREEAQHEQMVAKFGRPLLTVSVFAGDEKVCPIVSMNGMGIDAKTAGCALGIAMASLAKISSESLQLMVSNPLNGFARAALFKAGLDEGLNVKPEDGWSMKAIQPETT